MSQKKREPDLNPLLDTAKTIEQAMKKATTTQQKR